MISIKPSAVPDGASRFVSVVQLVHPCAELGAARHQFRRARHDGAEQGHAQREVRCGHHGDAACLRFVADGRFVRGPSGRSDHDRMTARWLEPESSRRPRRPSKNQSPRRRPASRRSAPRSRDRPTQRRRTRTPRSRTRRAGPYVRVRSPARGGGPGRHRSSGRTQAARGVERRFMQARHGRRNITIAEDDGDVPAGGCLRHHPQRHALERR